MKHNTSWWRALRRYFLVFTAIALLPLALVYLVRNEQIYHLKGYEPYRIKIDFNPRFFPEPRKLLDKNKNRKAEGIVMFLEEIESSREILYENANASRFNDHIGGQSFRYPVMLLGKNKDLRVAATGSSKKRFSKYAKYINESHVPVLPDDVVHTLSPADMVKVEKRMERRNKWLAEQCSELGLDVVGTDLWHKPNAWEFLVNRKYHIIWCNVFKAASSSWMFNFNVLAGYSPEFLQRTKEVLLSLARDRYPRVTLEQLREAQNDSITFMIARHPFERLLSAYRDKMVFALPHSFHDKLGRKIVRKYRKKGQDMHSPKYPTFPEFVRWLLNQIKMRYLHIDMHFVSPAMFCTPCLIHFDILMKFESLDEDQLYFIQKTGLSRVIAPEWRNAGKGKNTLDLLNSFYSKLTHEELSGLYEYYKYDFKLFNYSATPYFNIVQPPS